MNKLAIALILVMFSFIPIWRGGFTSWGFLKEHTIWAGKEG